MLGLNPKPQTLNSTCAWAARSLDEWVFNTEAHPLRVVQQLPDFLAAPAGQAGVPAVAHPADDADSVVRL